ncbi:Helix-turn-helix domain-containing protein [Pilibacter termitis]|uniref:Helix-turn-helix domain-containing protein n=1 Tax=Pilibacter termitis TaxID=263852 RepID=A0A1T4QXU3_9ENTE|nr:Helix-turn-helix domain-containing protein [Pilibacter termitis]
MKKETLLDYLQNTHLPFIYVENTKTKDILLHKKQGELFPKLTKNEFFKNLLDCHVESMREKMKMNQSVTEKEKNLYIFHDFLGLSFSLMIFPTQNILILAGAYRTENYERLESTPFKNAEIKDFVKLSREMDKIHSTEAKNKYDQLYDEVLVCLYSKKQIDFMKMTIFLKKNIETKFSLQELADRFYATERTVQRTFLTYGGKNFSSYYLDLRMCCAKEMIEERKLTLKEISDKLGYGNFSSFSRAFKSHWGISPKKYSNSFANKKSY